MKIYIYRFILFFVISFLIFPVSSSKATFPVPTPQALSYQLYYYFDLRDRDTTIQVTNNSSSSSVDVHVQIFRSNVGDCSEIDFYDSYTPNDTHIYNLDNLVGNLLPTPIVLGNNDFGFVVVTVVSDAIVGSLSVNMPVLSGEFRIKDNNGYEYRSNAVPYPVNATADSANGFNFNFSSDGASTFADVIGIAVSDAGEGFVGVSAGSSVSANFSLFMVDNIEIFTSCDEEQFTCAKNVALNDSIPNSKLAAANLCPFLLTPEGFTIMEESSLNPSTADFFVGFIGLNNANNKGGMEAFTATD